MLTKEDIFIVRERFLKYQENFRERLQRGSSVDADKSLAVLAQTEGWSILRAAFDGMILDLLEPEEFESSAESYALSSESRRIALQAIRSVIETVESSSSSARISESEGVSK